MKEIISYCILICWTTIVVVLAISSPEVISDNNAFLHSFVAQDFLGVLGVILAITIASAGQLHLELNKIEENHNTNNAFIKTRSGIKSAVYWLVSLFLSAIALVVTKPLLAQSDWSETLFNGGALLILVWNVLILVSITQAVFRVPSR